MKSESALPFAEAPGKQTCRLRGACSRVASALIGTTVVFAATNDIPRAGSYGEGKADYQVEAS